MFPSFMLALREGVEAALIIGILLGALRKVNRNELKPFVWRGVAAAGLLSLLAALALNLLGARFEGRAEQIFEGAAMLSAAVILTWMVFWMQRQAGSIKSGLEAEVVEAAFAGKGAIFALAFLAIGREGLELALFLTATSIDSGAWYTILGALLGLVASAALGYLLFATTYQLDLKRFFLVTNILLILFAAGLVAHGVHEFNEAGLVPAGIEHVWDTNDILDESSTLGEFLKALFGYNGDPSLTEVSAYLTYLMLVWFLFRFNNSRLRRVDQPAG